MEWKSASRIVFGLAFVAIGAIGLATGTFAPIWNPVPEAIPARELLVWLSTLVALACGAGLLVRRTAAWAALALTLFLILWTAAFKFPDIIRSPLVEGSYQSNGENWVLIAAAWLLHVELAGKRTLLASDVGRWIAWLLYGLALIAFGLSHFFYLDMTAPLVPAWLEAPVFWAYATGLIYTACGLAIITGAAPRLGALGGAANITLITVLVWGPMVAAGGLTPIHWQETVVSCALTAASWLIPTGSPPTTGWFHRPFPRDR